MVLGVTAKLQGKDDEIRRLKEENRRYKSDNAKMAKQLETEQKEKAKMAKQLDADESLWPSFTAKGRLKANTPSKIKIMHCLAMLEAILADAKALHAFTGLWPKEFAERMPVFENVMKSVAKPPLFRDYGDGRPGNRCSLYLRHAFMLALHHDRTNITQEQLGAIFGIDQSTVSDYIVRGSKTMVRIFPDPISISEVIKKCRSREEFEEWVPGGVLFIDGTRTPAVRPSNARKLKSMLSGKIKQYSLNTMIAVSCIGLTVWMSRTHPGSVHDLIISEELEDTFEYAIKKGWVRFVGDAGFLGIQNHIDGIVATVPHKSSKNHDLTENELADNAALSAERNIVENMIGRVKNNVIMRTKFAGTPGEFNRIFNIQSGKVNFHLCFDSIRKKSGVVGRFMTKKDRFWELAAERQLKRQQ